MSLCERDTPHISSSFPRVSGDEPGDHLTNGEIVEFSPRERG